MQALAPTPAAPAPAPAPSPAPVPSRNPLKRALDALDEYTRPRETTSGDLEENDYLQSLFHAWGAGYSFMGLTGVGVASACSVTSTWVARKTGSSLAALATGAVVGGVSAAVAAGMAGAVTPALVAGGVLLGGLQSLRGDKLSRVRDASGGATMVTGLFLPGTSKIAGAIAAGVGSSETKPLTRALVGAATGAALGAALGVAGLAPAGVAVTAVVSAAGGAVGPFFGPRFSQFFRNLANDCGKGVEKVARRLGIGEDRLDRDKLDMIGAFPAQFAKEAIRGFINSDFDVKGILASGLSESIETVHLFWAQSRDRKEKEEESGPVPPAAPPGA